MRPTVALAALAAILSAPPVPAQVWEVDNRLLVLASGGQELAHFGEELAVGDFNGDGLADLAVAAPEWDAGEQPDVGRIEIFRGAADRSLPFWAALTWAGADNLGAGSALAAGDFDGDGDDELAIGQPTRDVFASGSWQLEAGGVQVASWNGTSWALGAPLTQLQTLGSAPEAGDRFGSSLAAADFDDDGDDNLAIGVTGEDVNALAAVGMVHVLDGGPGGLATGGAYFLAGTDGLQGVPGSSDRFGWSLAAGDFDFDGFRDLAIGAPFRQVGSDFGAGQIHVLYGSTSGLGPSGNQLYDDGHLAGESVGPQEFFGYALAAGNFDYPGPICIVVALDACATDLAVGVPGEEFSFLGDDFPAAGKFVAMYGSVGGGVGPGGAQSIVQSAGSVPGTEEHFGAVLAAGGGLDSFVLGRQATDLVVTAPGEHHSGQLYVGMSDLWFGGASGLGSYSPQAQYSRPGLASNPPRSSDDFGSALAVGDFDGDGWGDLAIGISGRDRNGFDETGAVQIQFGALFADGFESLSLNNW